MERIRVTECCMSIVMLCTALRALGNVTVESNERTQALLSAQAGTLVLLGFAFGVGHHRGGARNQTTFLLFLATLSSLQPWVAITRGFAASVVVAFYYSWAFLAARLLLMTAEVQAHLHLT